ncbi:MAG TPA: cytochrome c oxidase subunit 3 family protein [Pyrinomonadaceae bacterium]|jgi:cytochrome c oxidase subunit 3
MATNVDTHDEHHYHPPGLQHQFEDMKQQEESVSLGMWAFLVQEIMFFGGLFTAYLVFRSRYPMAFAAGSNHLDAFWGGLNTLVLIVSSLTMALTVYYAQKGNRNMQVILIVLTMIFGTVFLGVKAIEYTDKFNHGLVPVAGLNKKIKENHNEPKGASAERPNTQTELESREKNSLDTPNAEHHANPRGDFQWTGESFEASKEIILEARDKGYLTSYEQVGYFSNGEIDQNKVQGKVRIFFWIYFVMTGLHALHMIIGLGLMTWLLIMAWRGTYSAEYYSPVEISGLYWHFVDIVWIFLFPLLYLLGRHFLHGGGH